MTGFERENLITSIENSALYIASEIKEETVDFILRKYGAESIEQIPTVICRKFSTSCMQSRLTYVLDELTGKVWRKPLRKIGGCCFSIEM